MLSVIEVPPVRPSFINANANRISANSQTTPNCNSITLKVWHAINTEIFHSVASNICLKSLKLGESGKQYCFASLPLIKLKGAQLKATDYTRRPNIVIINCNLHTSKVN